jgi:dTDP-4-amino-4,6-dideoxygalactose transaminase
MPSEEVRDRFLSLLRSRQIGAAFHYPPLHLTPMGRRLGGQAGDAPVTEAMATRVVRLPFYTDLSEGDQDRVIEVVRAFGARPSRRRPASGLAEKKHLV